MKNLCIITAATAAVTGTLVDYLGGEREREEKRERERESRKRA